MSQIGITIESINFNGQSVDISFAPYSGGTINLGTQTIPYDYLSTNYEGVYTIDIPSIPKTCTLTVGTAPSPTPTPSITVTPTVTPTPTPSIPSGDADATAYLAAVVSAGGTTDATIDAAVDTLFVDLKAAGVYNDLVAFYPLVGGVASSNLINANGNTSYDLALFGGWVHNTDGMISNGTNTYGDTSIIPATTLSATDNHTSSLFKDTSSIGSAYDGSGPSPYLISTSSRALEAFNSSAIMSGLGTIPTNGKAFIINVKENNTSAFAGTNADGAGYSVKSTKTNAATTVPTNSWTIGKINTVGFYTGVQYWFVTIGNGLTQTQASDLHDAIDTFATTLGRT
jgi:hypothetical protein